MATNIDLMFGRARFGEGPVPEVDPVDLQNVWKMQQAIQSARPNEAIDLSAEEYQRVSSPAANLWAVFSRVSILHLMQKEKMLESWEHEGILDDVVFNVAAKIPLQGMKIGVVYDGPRFDVAEFLRLVEKQASH